MPAPKTASSQVSWALLTEGVTQARVDMHRVRLMVERVQSMVERSPAKEHLYQVAGDILVGLPERLSRAENSLDRTSYALALMGENFLRGRLSLADRVRVDEAESTAPYSQDRRQKESLVDRVASRYLRANPAHRHFHDNPQKREVRQFAQTGAISNHPDIEPNSSAPPTPQETLAKPGAKQFKTLNRYIVQTEQGGVGQVPQDRSELPRHPPTSGRHL